MSAVDSQTRILIGAILVLTVLAAVVYLSPIIDEKLLQPRLTQAWVAIEVDGAGHADIGVVRIEAGTPFELHAVLEATTRGGDAVYYTEAPALRFLEADGTPRPVLASAVRTWDRQSSVRQRWFTVEGRQPFLRLAPGEDASAYRIELFFRPDWRNEWSVAGVVEATNDDQFDVGSRLDPKAQEFGTQRYHVRIELYSDEESVLPDQRVASPGPDALAAEPETFSTVVASLPGALAPASRVFGLTQIQAPAEASAELRSGLTALANRGLAFTRLTVLRDQLRQVGDELPWQELDLGASPQWNVAVKPGDLVRVGERVVVLYQDRGQAGILDYEDLCFDYVAGATVRALSDVFSGQDPVLEHRAL